MKQNKYMFGSPVLMGDSTVPGLAVPEDLKRLLPEIFRRVHEFGCDFPPTVVEMLTYDEISEIAAYGGFPVRYPHWRWGMEYEELQQGYMHGQHRIYEMVVNCCGLKTRVLTDRGTIFAEDVREGDFVYGRRGPRKVALVNRQKQSPTLKIRLKDQFREVTCTHNHKWLVVCDEGYIWREAKDLSKGDFIVGFDGKSCPAKKPCKLNFNDEKCIKDTRPNIRARVKNINTPSHMTEELAELIGILIGDGCITAKGSSRNTITVCVGLEHESYAKYVARLFFKCFGKKAVIYKKPSCFLVTLCSKMAMYFFDHIGLKKGSCFLDKRIPSAIWGSSSEFRRACLKGLFDTDGHISTRIQYSSKSKGLIEDMQLMLAELGVYSRAKHISNRHNNIFVLNVSGRASIKKFAKIIVPKQKYKNEALKKIANTAYCSSNGQALPYFRQRIIDSLPEIRSVDDLNMYYACKRIKKGKFESNALYSFCERAEESNVKMCEDIKSELETPFYEVEEVLDDVSQETIDIALFHDDHDFVAEGLMSHNTNPCYLYCLDSNTLVDNVTVVAHALGHADFFKNNIYFGQTSQNMMNELANHGTRIRRYMTRWGKERVTEFIDHVLRIETLIDTSKAWEPKRYKDSITKDSRKYHHPSRLKVEDGHDYMEGYLNTEEWMRKQRETIEKIETAEYLDMFVGSTKDIMGFIRDNAPLKPWESDIVSMLYEESIYFAPQRMTKTINEGHACVAPDTLIATDKGILTAQELVERKVPCVVSDGEDNRSVSNWFRFDRRKTVTIETKRGYKITGSDNHRIMDASDHWEHMRDIKEGRKIKISGSDIWPSDMVLIDYQEEERIDSKKIREILGSRYWKYNYHRTGFYTEKQAGAEIAELSKAFDEQRSRLGQTQVIRRSKIRIPSIVDENLASFLGYLIGDGHISETGRTLGLTSGDLEQVESFEALLESLFGLRAKRRWDGSSKNGRWRVSFSSKSLQEFLKSLGLPTGRCARKKSIPECILRSPKNVMSAFLRSYFDCDGYAGKAGVILSTSSERMGEQVQNVLLNYGIICSRKKARSSDESKTHIWHVRMGGIQTKKFSEEIGFGLKRKQESLTRHINDRIWFTRENWTDVVVSTSEGEGTVYDITVDDTHRYAAHGFVNHNSWVDYNIIAKQGLASLGLEQESGGIIEYAQHKMGVLGGKYSMNPYKLGFNLLCDIEDRWDRGQFGREWEECEDIREKENWDRNLGLGREKVFEVRKLYNDLTLIAEFFTPEFCNKYEFFEWKRYPNGEYKIESKDPHRIKAKLISRYTNGGLPDIRLVDPNHKGKGIMFLQHNWTGRPLHDAYVGPVLESLRKLWKNDVCLATKNASGTEMIYRCRGDDCEVDVVSRSYYEDH